MRKLMAIPFLFLIACEGGPVERTTTGALVCSGSDVPIYKNRFAPTAGASGVATGAEAVAGVISSDAPTSTSSVGVTTEAVAPTVSALSSDGAGGAAASGSGDVTAMDVSCGSAPCAQGQVAVEVPPKVTPSTTTSPTAIGASPPTTATSVITSPLSSDATAGAATPASGNGSDFECTNPPPDCPQGQSPQYTSKHTWECTDCSLVVTYGGAYGNYRRCVNMPHVVCPAGEVPTWVYEDEQWECKTKCDNGQYDQHTVEGLMVCVPC